MTSFDRRRFLGSAAALGGALLAAGCATPEGLRAAGAPGPASSAGLATAGAGMPGAGAIGSGLPPARLNDIDHIIVLMKENRSFDHYFGTLAGVRGFDDRTALRLPGGRSVFAQPDTLNPDGFVLPFHLDTRRTSAQRLHDLNHSWGPLHSCLNQGALDSFVRVHRDMDGDAGPLTMGYLGRDDVPLYYALADAFTVCDGYHASVLGPTHPNRLFLMTGSVDADSQFGKPSTNNSGRDLGWETYPERLNDGLITCLIYIDL
jgi:phospholipase C